MTREEYASILVPNITHTRKYYEELYKKRDLKEDAMVVRIGPSPTGSVHIGTLYQAIVAKRFASQTNGVCFLRIEDTDQKREVEDGVNLILNSLAKYNIGFDESPIEGGEYGPYIQSERKEIYGAFVKDLIEKDLAYPSFITEEEKKSITEAQTKSKGRIGYFGPWAAKERALSIEEVLNKIKDGIEEKEGVTKVSYHNEGRILNFTIKVDGNTKLDTAKEYAEEVIKGISKKNLKYYDVQVFLDSDENTTDYPTAGYKNKNAKKLVWGNVGGSSE